MLFPDPSGTRLAFIDDKGDGYIFNPVRLHCANDYSNSNRLLYGMAAEFDDGPPLLGTAIAKGHNMSTAAIWHIQ